MSDIPTPVLSTGQPSTLGVWRDNAASIFAAESAALELLDSKIANDPRGRETPVLVDERQLILLLTAIDAVGTAEELTVVIAADVQYVEVNLN